MLSPFNSSGKRSQSPPSPPPSQSKRSKTSFQGNASPSPNPHPAEQPVFLVRVRDPMAFEPAVQPPLPPLLPDHQRLFFTSNPEAIQLSRLESGEVLKGHRPSLHKDVHVNELQSTPLMPRPEWSEPFTPEGRFIKTGSELVVDNLYARPEDIESLLSPRTLTLDNALYDVGKKGLEEQKQDVDASVFRLQLADSLNLKKEMQRERYWLLGALKAEHLELTPAKIKELRNSDTGEWKKTVEEWIDKKDEAGVFPECTRDIFERQGFMAGLMHRMKERAADRNREPYPHEWDNLWHEKAGQAKNMNAFKGMLDREGFKYHPVYLEKAFIKALEADRIEEARVYLDWGLPYSNLSTEPLRKAARDGRHELVLEALDKGIWNSPHASSSNHAHSRLLNDAINDGNRAFALALVKHQGNFANSYDAELNMKAAIKQGDAELVGAMVSHGALDPLHQNYISNFIRDAAQENHADVLLELLTKGELEKRGISMKGCWNRDAEEAMMCAARTGHQELLLELLRQGVDPEGHTSSLNLASRVGHWNFVEKVMEREFPLRNDSFGHTELFLNAAKQGKQNILETMLQRGYVPEYSEKSWDTLPKALEAAREQKETYPGMLALLEKLEQTLKKGA